MKGARYYYKLDSGTPGKGRQKSAAEEYRQKRFAARCEHFNYDPKNIISKEVCGANQIMWSTK